MVEGVSALHAGGVVHGDLKPSNILVSADGRVVLLDFGLVREIAQRPTLVAGTPAYMAPETLAQAPVAEAADWYSVGVLLYEAMTTTVPFTGTFWDILRKKQQEDVTVPETGDLPASLISLCEGLLRRRPDERPSGREILGRLVEQRSAGIDAPPPDDKRLFVGRRQHLGVLRDGFDRVGHGHTTAIHVHGPSGIGKSTLVRHFLETVQREHPDVVVLAGRCYEAESVPFKTLDELIDRLSRFLGALDDGELNALMPTDVVLLTRVFPALARVAIRGGPQRLSPGPPEPRELRDRALAALQELFERLSRRRRVVLWLDDLQWGDLDSIRVLRDLQQPSGAPGLLLILSYRSDASSTNPVLQALAASASAGKDAGTVGELAVGELLPQEAIELVDALSVPLHEVDRSAIVSEAEGSPLFLQELVRHVATAPRSVGHAPSLSVMIQRRVQRLPTAPRRLLDVIAIAGQPLERPIAAQAAAVTDPGAESFLIDERLVRASRFTEAGELDTYHDKVREAVLELMSADGRCACHGRVARALDTGGHANPEQLVHHFTKAGIESEAYRCALHAAEAADDALAFEQAASLFRLAVDLRTRMSSPSLSVPGERRLDDLWRRLALALANGGRSADAASAYLQAASLARPDEGHDLRSLAVDQLMRSGQINAGLHLLTTLLRERGIRIPRGRLGLMAAAVGTRLRIRLSGLRYRERSSDANAFAALQDIDRLWTAGATLTAIDPLLSSYMRGQHLVRALRAGDPYRISMGLGLEAVQQVLWDANAYPTARRILDRAREIVVHTNQPYAEAMALTAEAGVAYYSGRVRDALRYGVEGEDILNTRCTGVAWELAACRMWILSALSLSGRWKEYVSRLGAIVQEAERNNDLYAQYALPLSTGCWIAHLAADDPESARRLIDEKIAKWGRREFDVPRASHWYGTVEILMYQQRYDEAWQLITATRPTLRRNMILRVGFLRAVANHARGRCAIGLHAVAPRPALLAVAERVTVEAARSASTYVQGSGLVLEAALHVSRGRREAAIAKLQLAEERLHDAGALQTLAAARRRRGQIIGGDTGANLIRVADSELMSLGATDPARMTERLVPGRFCD